MNIETGQIGMIDELLKEDPKAKLVPVPEGKIDEAMTMNRNQRRLYAKYLKRGVPDAFERAMRECKK